MSDPTQEEPIVPKAYAEAEGPTLVDQWWHWSVVKAFVMSVFIGVGAVAWGFGAGFVGQLLMVLGVLWYLISPKVRGPITS